MATIDKLLLALASKRMDCLVLEPGRRPCLRQGGTDHEVTKAPLDGQVIDRLLREVSPPGEDPDTQEQNRWEFDYAVDGKVFRFFGLRGPSGWLASVTHDPKAKPSPKAASQPPPDPDLFAPPATAPSAPEVATAPTESAPPEVAADAGPGPQLVSGPLSSAPPPRDLWPTPTGSPPSGVGSGVEGDSNPTPPPAPAKAACEGVAAASAAAETPPKPSPEPSRQEETPPLGPRPVPDPQPASQPAAQPKVAPSVVKAQETKTDASAAAKAGPASEPKPKSAAEPAPSPPAAARKETPSRSEYVVGDVRSLLVEVVGRGASDLHLSAGQAPRIRIDGQLLALDGYQPPGADRLESMLRDVCPDPSWRQLEERGDTEFAFELEGRGRFRVHLFRDRRGTGGAFRLVPPEIFSIEELGLPDIAKGLTALDDGLILVAGTASSGRTTTLASLIEEINRQRTAHIVTLEEPVEFIFRSGRSLISQRQIGLDTETYGDALRAALRKDPDVIVVGELRSPETASLVVETADTGHLMLSTVHASSATSAVERLIDQAPPSEQSRMRRMLASSLRAVLHQTLLRRRGGGRVAAYEILLITRPIAELIRNQRTSEIPAAIEQGQKLGMVRRDESLFRLVHMGLVDPQEAYRNAADKAAFSTRLKQLEKDSEDEGDNTDGASG